MAKLAELSIEYAVQRVASEGTILMRFVFFLVDKMRTAYTIAGNRFTQQSIHSLRTFEILSRGEGAQLYRLSPVDAYAVALGTNEGILTVQFTL